MFLHLSYSIIIYSIWGGRDLNKIQTPAQGQWDLDRVGTAAGEGQEGCVAKRLPAWGYPNIAGWFILVRGKMENPWWWFVHVCSVCSCLFSTYVFPAGSKAIPWAEVKWIWAPKRFPHVTSSQAQECLSATVDCLPALKHLVPLRWQVIFVGRRLGDDLQTCQMVQRIH